MKSSLLPPRDLERPAITTAMNAKVSLRLIVELLSKETKQVDPATIRDNSFKLIDWLWREQLLLHIFLKMLSFTPQMNRIMREHGLKQPPFKPPS
jgi:hypothetical protein